MKKKERCEKCDYCEECGRSKMDTMVERPTYPYLWWNQTYPTTTISTTPYRINYSNTSGALDG